MLPTLFLWTPMALAWELVSVWARLVQRISAARYSPMRIPRTRCLIHAPCRVLRRIRLVTLPRVPANNSTFGTVDLRRTFTNNTGAPLTRLRFRILNIATFPAASGIADLRPISSADLASVTVDRPPCGVGTSNIPVGGTTLEVDNTAPSTGQPNGGGFNSTFSTGAVTVATPLANGASIDLHFLFGIQQTGSYKLAVIAEALPTGGDLWILTGNTEDASDVEGVATPPVIAQQGPLTRQQGSPAINSTIATVSDTNARHIDRNGHDRARRHYGVKHR